MCVLETVVIITCPKCGTKNRVEDRPGRVPVCGRCGTELPSTTGPVELTDATFDRIIGDAGARPVLVDCWAPWCGPCRMIAPIINELARESNGRYVVAKLNVDENPGVSRQYQISSIPTMLLFKGGRLVDQIVGMRTKSALQARLEE